MFHNINMDNFMRNVYAKRDNIHRKIEFIYKILQNKPSKILCLQ
jgi:hypothetical protein